MDSSFFSDEKKIIFISNCFYTGALLILKVTFLYIFDNK